MLPKLSETAYNRDTAPILSSFPGPSVAESAEKLFMANAISGQPIAASRPPRQGGSGRFVAAATRAVVSF
jgi:hypothetical protein